MSIVDVVVVVAAVAAIAGLAWYFFAPRQATHAELTGGVQRVHVVVRGGYSPNVLQVRQGVPVEIEFDRQESGDCSSRVVFPELELSAALPAYQRTTVRFTPQHAGSFGFACGMNMIHGTLVVAADGKLIRRRSRRSRWPRVLQPIVLPSPPRRWKRRKPPNGMRRSPISLAG